MPHHRNRAALVALVAFAATSSACGPSPWQAGTAVLLATPVAVLVGHLLLLALVRLWRARQPTLTLPWRAPLAVGVGALALGAGLALASPERSLSDWPAVAILTFGSSYLVVLLVAFRVALAVRPARAASLALVAAVTLMVVPALFALVDVVDLGLWLMLWLYTGIYGIPTVIILTALLIEAATRGTRRPGP